MLIMLLRKAADGIRLTEHIEAHMGPQSSDMPALWA